MTKVIVAAEETLAFILTRILCSDVYGCDKASFGCGFVAW